jgi:chemotaxis signal transduction protein
MAQEEMEHLRQRVQPGEATAEVDAGSQYLLFTCGGVRCAVALRTLREVLSHVPTTVPLPHSPPWTVGMFALRSELIALVDPAPALLGATPGEARAPVSAVLLVGSGPRTLGWTVGDVGAIAAVRPEEIAPAPRSAPVWERYALGVCAPATGEGTAILLDADRLLDDLLNELEEREQRNG